MLKAGGLFVMLSDDLEKEIRKTAYELWQKANRPEGRDLEFWLIAERQVFEQWKRQFLDSFQHKNEHLEFWLSSERPVFGEEWDRFVIETAVAPLKKSAFKDILKTFNEVNDTLLRNTVRNPADENWLIFRHNGQNIRFSKNYIQI